MPYLDTTIWFLIPSFLLAMYAQMKVQSTFRKYLTVPARRGYTGREVARSILDRAGLHDVPVEMIHRSLGDHYDPRQRVVRLSPEVYNGRSVASVGVAAHEVGHALQHAQAYIPLNVRSAVFPLARFGSTLAFPLFFIGFILESYSLVTIGIWFFLAALLFQLVTLPVEFNASARAMRLLTTGGYLGTDEAPHTKAVLNAAALTYVAAVAVALSQLLRLLVLRGSMRRD